MGRRERRRRRQAAKAASGDPKQVATVIANGANLDVGKVAHYLHSCRTDILKQIHEVLTLRLEALKIAVVAAEPLRPAGGGDFTVVPTFNVRTLFNFFDKATVNEADVLLRVLATLNKRLVF